MLRFIIVGLLLLSWSVSSQSMEPVNFSGTWANSAYFNNDIDVISETVEIDIDITDNATTNDRYMVTYELYNRHEGLTLPAVFEVLDAFGKNDDFEVFVDGQSVPVAIIVEDDTVLDVADFYMPNNTGWDQFRAESKYISVNLSQGLHTIKAIYDVQPHYYGSDWTARHTYSYILKPMQHSDTQGKKFLGSTTKLNFVGDTDYITVDIDNEQATLPANQQFHFNENVAKEIDFIVQKPLSPVAKILTSASPLVVIVALFILGRMHLRMMSRRKENQPESHWSSMLLGGFLVPLLSLIIYYIYLLVTDMVIGKGATGDSRSLFFMWVLPLGYIVITPVYLVISFVAFIMVKKKGIEKA